MTVGELIEKLKTFPADENVVVMGYNYGYDEPVVYPCPISIIFDVNWDGEKKVQGGEGRHDSPETLDMSRWKRAVLIGR